MDYIDHLLYTLSTVLSLDFKPSWLYIIHLMFYHKSTHIFARMCKTSGVISFQLFQLYKTLFCLILQAVNCYHIILIIIIISTVVCSANFAVYWFDFYPQSSLEGQHIHFKQLTFLLKYKVDFNLDQAVVRTHTLSLINVRQLLFIIEAQFNRLVGNIE